MSFLYGLVAFLAASLVARGYRAWSGVWVPGWTGGISLLGLFLLFFVAAIAFGAPAWLEGVFFAIVGAHVGAYIQLGRIKFEGHWWEVWR
jgi:hypothetical protein